MSSLLDIEAAGRTHVGHVRKRNEDALYVGEWLYVVADGLGGHVAGDIASTTAIEAVKPYDRRVTTTQLENVLGRAISEADASIRRRVRSEPELAGMGTTMVAILRSGDAAVVANIGDSRAYVLRNARARSRPLVQVSEDHTYQFLVADADRVPSLPGKLARFLDGRKDGRSPDLTKLHLEPGDRVLLCSDGLSSYVPAAIIRAALMSARHVSDAADRLIQAALEHGGPDNVSVVVLQALAASVGMSATVHDV